MAAATPPSTIIPALHVEELFFVAEQATAAAANTIAHGLSITPTVFLVTHNDATAILSAISADATNVNYTSSTTGTCQILAF